MKIRNLIKTVVKIAPIAYPIIKKIIASKSGKSTPSTTSRRK